MKCELVIYPQTFMRNVRGSYEVRPGVCNRFCVVLRDILDVLRGSGKYPPVLELVSFR